MIAAPDPLPVPMPLRWIKLPLTDKAHAGVLAEAKARDIPIERLILVALADYLGRNDKAGAAKKQPLILHIPWSVRKRIVTAAMTEGLTVNQFMIAAATAALRCPPARET